ncbi:hypothetical protein C0J52_12190 [Blattella germanica]|nr:hypothetical protein C0J52_12190 [Blattella germanica]
MISLYEKNELETYNLTVLSYILKAVRLEIRGDVQYTINSFIIILSKIVYTRIKTGSDFNFDLLVQLAISLGQCVNFVHDETVKTRLKFISDILSKEITTELDGIIKLHFFIKTFNKHLTENTKECFRSVMLANAKIIIKSHKYNSIESINIVILRDCVLALHFWHERDDKDKSIIRRAIFSIANSLITKFKKSTDDPLKEPDAEMKKQKEPEVSSFTDSKQVEDEDAENPSISSSASPTEIIGSNAVEEQKETEQSSSTRFKLLEKQKETDPTSSDDSKEVDEAATEHQSITSSTSSASSPSASVELNEIEEQKENETSFSTDSKEVDESVGHPPPSIVSASLPTSTGLQNVERQRENELIHASFKKLVYDFHRLVLTSRREIKLGTVVNNYTEKILEVLSDTESKELEGIELVTLSDLLNAVIAIPSHSSYFDICHRIAEILIRLYNSNQLPSRGCNDSVFTKLVINFAHLCRHEPSSIEFENAYEIVAGMLNKQYDEGVLQGYAFHNLCSIIFSLSSFTNPESYNLRKITCINIAKIIAEHEDLIHVETPTSMSKLIKGLEQCYKRKQPDAEMMKQKEPEVSSFTDSKQEDEEAENPSISSSTSPTEIIESKAVEEQKETEQSSSTILKAVEEQKETDQSSSTRLKSLEKQKETVPLSSGDSKEEEEAATENPSCTSSTSSASSPLPSVELNEIQEQMENETSFSTDSKEVEKSVGHPPPSLVSAALPTSTGLQNVERQRENELIHANFKKLVYDFHRLVMTSRGDIKLDTKVINYTEKLFEFLSDTESKELEGIELVTLGDLLNDAISISPDFDCLHICHLIAKTLIMLYNSNQLPSTGCNDSVFTKLVKSFAWLCRHKKYSIEFENAYEIVAGMLNKQYDEGVLQGYAFHNLCSLIFSLSWFTNPESYNLRKITCINIAKIIVEHEELIYVKARFPMHKLIIGLAECCKRYNEGYFTDALICTYKYMISLYEKNELESYNLEDFSCVLMSIRFAIKCDTKNTIKSFLIILSKIVYTRIKNGSEYNFGLYVHVAANLGQCVNIVNDETVKYRLTFISDILAKEITTEFDGIIQLNFLIVTFNKHLTEDAKECFRSSKDDPLTVNFSTLVLTLSKYKAYDTNLSIRLACNMIAKMFKKPYKDGSPFIYELNHLCFFIEGFGKWYNETLAFKKALIELAFEVNKLHTDLPNLSPRFLSTLANNFVKFCDDADDEESYHFVLGMYLIAKAVFTNYEIEITFNRKFNVGQKDKSCVQMYLNNLTWKTF